MISGFMSETSHQDEIAYSIGNLHCQDIYWLISEYMSERSQPFSQIEVLHRASLLADI